MSGEEPLYDAADAEIPPVDLSRFTPWYINLMDAEGRLVTRLYPAEPGSSELVRFSWGASGILTMDVEEEPEEVPAWQETTRRVRESARKAMREFARRSEEEYERRMRVEEEQ